MAFDPLWVKSGTWARLTCAALSAAALAACGGQSSPAAGARVVRVDLSDFRVEAPAVVRSGDVVVAAHNLGPDMHELVVARGESPDELPLRNDGIMVDEAGLDGVGAVEPFGTGGSEELVTHLDPGRYVFFCNMPGHFLGGMHAVVMVR